MKLPVTIKDQTIEVDIPEASLIAAGWKKPVSKGRWKPKFGESYYYYTNGIKNDYVFHNDSADDSILSSCVVHKTREEAEKALARQKAIIRVNDRIDELNEGWEPEWDGTSVKTSIVQYRDFVGSRRLSTIDCIGLDNLPLLHYCKSEKVARQIIRECEADLKVIFEV